MTTVSFEYGENKDTCIWNGLFNNEERVTLQRGFLFTGLLSVLFSSWLSVTLLFTNLRFDNSYRNLANYTVTASIRRIIPVISYLPLVKCIETLFGFLTFSCNFFAFFETFLAVFEVECLTHVCIERYVVAKYITNGWQIQKKHYYLYVCLCVFFSCLYSVPPLFGIGRYGYDFQCTSCTFDMVLPDTWQRYIIVAIFILRSAKPVLVMMMMLIWARVLERKLTSLTSNQHFTRTVTVITLVNILCWTPIALIRGNVVLSSFMAVDLLPMPARAYVTWAMWVHWVAPALTAIAVFLVDDRVRCKMFNLCLDDTVVTDDKKD
ncbi:rhodopsin, GQ-coupled-like [Trichoplusia ni]|uniref:Rhodopsin, GQ-coupled-like n=1 Tax=Trichoplusia ni TaxID=7111 RepID=A0A7E5VEQ1_TRINI|nr:rhodopsin, GQ-coupled-like [Trichoplusia ni]